MPQDFRNVLRNVFRSQAEPNQIFNLFNDFVAPDDGEISNQSLSNSCSRPNYVHEKRLGFPNNSCGVIPIEYNEEFAKIYNSREKNFERKFDSQIKNKTIKWDDIIANSGGEDKTLKIQKYGKKIRSVIRSKGIPPTYRAKVWLETSGAYKKLAHNKGYYKAMIEENKNYSQVTEAERQIDLDLDRTFPQHPFFNKSTGDGVERLRRVLVTFCRRNAFVAYCQSFNYIVGMLLLHMDEEEAFWMFVVILEEILPADYYNPKLKGMRTDVKVLDSLIEFYLPKIHRKFSEIGMDIAAFASKWFMTLFVDVFPLETSLRVWDIFFYEGSKTLFRVALGFLKKNENAILKFNRVGDILSLLLQAPSLLFDVDSLLYHSFSFYNLKNNSLKIKRASCSSEIEKEDQKIEERRSLKLKELNERKENNKEKILDEQNQSSSFEEENSNITNSSLNEEKLVNPIEKIEGKFMNSTIGELSPKTFLSPINFSHDNFSPTDSPMELHSDHSINHDFSFNIKENNHQCSISTLPNKSNAHKLYKELNSLYHDNEDDRHQLEEIMKEHQIYIITNQYSFL